MAAIDPLDARILLALDEDPEATTLALARTLGVARNTVHARLRRIHRDGALATPSQRVRPAALGFPLIAFVSIAISQSAGESAVAAMQELPEVVELHATTGDADLLARVVARDPQDLHRVTNAMLAIEGIERTSTVLSLVEEMPLRVHPLLEAVAGGAAR